jgi:hypothetical protein
MLISYQGKMLPIHKNKYLEIGVKYWQNKHNCLQLLRLAMKDCYAIFPKFRLILKKIPSEH